MTKRIRQKAKRNSSRRVWIFSEPNPDLTPDDLARILARAALQAAERAKTAGEPKERSDD